MLAHRGEPNSLKREKDTILARRMKSVATEVKII